MVKEGSSDYIKVMKRWFFKELLTEGFFVEPKLVLLCHRREEPFEAPLFLRACYTELLWEEHDCSTNLFLPQC